MNIKLTAALLAATTLAAPVLANEVRDSAADAIVVTGVLADDDTPLNPVRLPQSARISSQTLGRRMSISARRATSSTC